MAACFLGSEDLTWLPIGLDGKTYSTAKLIRFVGGYWIFTGLKQKAMKTSGKCPAPRSGEGSISSPEGFRANPLVTPGSEEAQRMTAISGRQCLESFNRSGPVGSWLKMFPGLLVGRKAWYSGRCMLTWRLKVTRYCRSLFQLLASAPRTGGNDSGLLPTPLVKDTGATTSLVTIDQRRQRIKAMGINGNGFGMSLGEYAQRGMLPTPVANEEGWLGQEITDRHGNPPTAISQSVYNMKTGKRIHKKLSYLLKMGLLPTPTSVSDAKGGSTRKSPALQRATLAHSIHGMAGQPGGTSHLNPRFVAEMMGFPNYWLELPFLGFIRNA